MTSATFKKDLQYYKFCLYGFLKNLRFFDFFLILFFTDEKGLEYTLIMSLYAIKFIIRTIFEIPSGVIADSLGRKKTLMVSFAGYILSFIIYFISGNYLLLITASIVYGLSDAFRTGTHKAMIFDYLKLNNWKNQKVKYYGQTRSWSQLGSALSSLIGAFLVMITGNYAYIFLFSIIPYLAGMVILSTYPSQIDKQTASDNVPPLRRIVIRTKETLLSLKVMQKNLSLIRVSSFSGYFMAVKDLIQPMIVNLSLMFPVLYAFDKKQMSAIWIGIVYFVIYFISAFASKYSVRVLERFRHYYRAMDILFIVGLLAGVITGMLTTFENYTWPVILMVLIFAIENARKPIGVSCLSSIYDTSITATVLSMSSQLGSVIASMIALLLGFTIDKLGLGKGFALTSLSLLLLYFVLILVSNYFFSDDKDNYRTIE